MKTVLSSDMRDSHLSLKLQLFKGRLFDAFKKEKSEPEAKSEDDSEEEPKTYLSSVDNLLDYLFSNCELTFNNTRASNAMEINPQREQLLNEFSLSALSNKRTLACHGYSFEELREAFGMCSFTD